MVPVLAGLVGPVGEPVDLGGSGRSVVWPVPAGGASYVVKVHLEEDEAFGREAAALDALTGSGVGPDLVGVDGGRRLLRMEDLAPGHEEPDNLALALPGTDRPLARTRHRAGLPGLGLEPGDALEVLADVPHRLSRARVLAFWSLSGRSGRTRPGLPSGP